MEAPVVIVFLVLIIGYKGLSILELALCGNLLLQLSFYEGNILRGTTEKRLAHELGKLLANGGNLSKGLCELLERKDLTTWHPIETAPKDRRILLFYPDLLGTKTMLAQELDRARELYPDYEPSHWAELPEDPK